VAFIIWIKGIWRKAAFRLRILEIFEVWLFVPRTPCIFALRQIDTSLTVSSVVQDAADREGASGRE
jgi:hypothetical protein